MIKIMFTSAAGEKKSILPLGKAFSKAKSFEMLPNPAKIGSDKF